jgi:activating signal cointegrator complex subunit 3
MSIKALGNDKFESLYSSKFKFFNPVQTQVFHTLFHTDSNSLIGAPTGSGKTIMAEMAMLRVFKNNPKHKIIFIAPLKALAKERIIDWKTRLELGSLQKSVLELTGDITPDLKALQKADVLITTPEKWDGISRNWQHRSYVSEVALVIIDEIHLLGQERGPVIEVIISRMRYISE